MRTLSRVAEWKPAWYILGGIIVAAGVGYMTIGGVGAVLFGVVLILAGGAIAYFGAKD